MNTDNTRELLQEIDTYIEDLFAPSDEVLEAALRDSRRAGLPEINVSPNQGRLLQLLTEIAGARRILEIGTLGGYSAIHFARALPEDGALISLEIDEHHAGVARNNIHRAGLSEKVEIRVGDAHETPRLAHRGRRTPLRRDLHRRRQRGLPRLPRRVPAPRAIRIPNPRRQHHKGRHRTRPQGRNGPGHARIQRAWWQRPQALQHRLTPHQGAHRRPDHSKGPVGWSVDLRFDTRKRFRYGKPM